MADRYAIIVGGGSGSRMNAGLPKQFIEIEGLPLILHTCNVFISACKDIKLIIVLPEKWLTHWAELCHRFGFCHPHNTAPGGPERFHSVKSGLSLITDPHAVIAIHDSVRPLVNAEVILNAFNEAEEHGNAVPCIAIRDSIREKTAAASRPVDRNRYVLVQTPQCFRADIIKTAYRANYDPAFTDDATVAEASGVSIRLIAGNEENIKITRPSDLLYAQGIIAAQKNALSE